MTRRGGKKHLEKPNRNPNHNPNPNPNPNPNGVERCHLRYLSTPFGSKTMRWTVDGFPFLPVLTTVEGHSVDGIL